jgi:hypothetical protein
MMNNGPVSWSSTLMKTVALSTAESEIGSAVESAKTGVHLRLMVSELSRRRPRKVIIMEDNTAAISMAGQSIRHVTNAKHFEVRLRYLQELVDEGKLELRHVGTNEQLGDSMTKPLDETKFEYFRSIAGPKAFPLCRRLPRSRHSSGQSRDHHVISIREERL